MIKLKNIAAAGLLWAAAFGCAGCGAHVDLSDFSENTLAIRKDGSVAELSVESFGEAYYSLEALKTYVNDQVDAYNAAHLPESGKEEDPVIRVDEVTADQENARVILTYESIEDYADFNYTNLEVTGATQLCKDAAALNLKDMEGADVGTALTLENAKDYEAVVVYTKHDIVVPGEIAYVSSNVKVLSESTAKCDGTLSVILYR